ncbi:MAG TPA: anti-sigma factor [Anaerolineae bacterium]|nr:anti-sigma factor [Anaerolineae bacterium]
MNTELTHDQILAMLPAYALGALEPEEMLAVDAYLNQNRALLDRLHQVELAVAQMAHAAPDTPLPATAKNRLMARVRADMGMPDAAEMAQADVTSQPSESARLTPPKRLAPSPRSAGWLAGLRRAFTPVNGWAVATACAVVALVGVSLYIGQIQGRLTQVNARLDTLQGELSQLQASNTQLQETNESLQRELQTNQNGLQQAEVELDALQAQTAELQAANTQLQQTNETLQQQAQADQELLALIAQADPERTVQLPGTAEAPNASGSFYVSDDEGLLVLRGLEPLPTDQTYQLWLIPADGPPESAGLLAVQANAPTWLTLPLPAETQDFAAVGVSIEPAGGSPAPTTVVLLGPVS